MTRRPRIKYPRVANRRKRAQRAAAADWVTPWCKLAQQDAVFRARLMWQDGYDAAMRDARKGLT